ncbi:MAG: NAD(P)H-hydrate dehydratase [Elusimicrobia bacterium]|nr:NAD(P)H-hydrate dehydratase [Elusimicrobiota bacterium]
MRSRRLSRAAVRRWLVRRELAAHKGDFGHVLIVGGSRGMVGAAALAARAALRCGAGLVTLGVPEGQQAAAAGFAPEVLTSALPQTRQGIISGAAATLLRRLHSKRRYSVLALGPGISTGARAAVLSILEALRIPTVLDADALNILALEPRRTLRRLLARDGAPGILTPHPGEMARLCATSPRAVQAGRVAAAVGLARELGIVCALKGHATVVTDGKRVAINPTGNPGLAKGGSGDVLTGIIAALGGQRLASGKGRDGGFEAAALGVFLHGLSADIAVREKTQFSLLASDVIEALPAAFQRLG